MTLEGEINTVAELMLAKGVTRMQHSFERRVKLGQPGQQVHVAIEVRVMEVPATDPEYDKYYDRCEQANRQPLSYAEWQKARHV